MGKLEPAAFESLEHLGHGLVTQLRGRLALVAVEVSEEEIRFARRLGWQLFALFLSCLTLSLAVLLVLVAFWDAPQRLAAVTVALVLTALGAGAAWWIHRTHVREAPVVLSQTLEELRRDAEALTPRSRGNGATAAAPAHASRPLA